MPAPLPLYEIDAELEALEAALLDAGGEITDDLEATYHDLLDMRAEKVAGYVAVIRRLELSADAYDAEVKRLTAHRNAMRSSAQRLKERLCTPCAAAARTTTTRLSAASASSARARARSSSSWTP